MPTFGPALAVNDVIQVVLYSQCIEQAGLNVIHFKVNALSTAGTNQLSRIVDAIEASELELRLKACMVDDAVYRGFTVQRVIGGLSLAYASRTNTGTGATVGDPMARQVAGIIQKRSAIAGRRKGGRMYVPFPSANEADAGGVPGGGYQAKLDSLAAQLQSVFPWGTGGEMYSVIYQRARAVLGIPVAATTRDIASWRPLPRWATQRRRSSFGASNALVV